MTCGHSANYALPDGRIGCALCHLEQAKDLLRAVLRSGYLWSYEDALNGAWLSRGEFERLEAVLHAEHTRSSHWRGCHESHPIRAYLREIQMWGDDNSPPSGEVGK